MGGIYDFWDVRACGDTVFHISPESPKRFPLILTFRIMPRFLGRARRLALKESTTYVWHAGCSLIGVRANDRKVTSAVLATGPKVRKDASSPENLRLHRGCTEWLHVASLNVPVMTTGLRWPDGSHGKLLCADLGRYPRANGANLAY